MMRNQLFALLTLPFLALASASPHPAQKPISIEEYGSDAAQMQTYNAQPSLADLLTIESSASIFFSYARELELSSMFVGEGPDGDVKMTLLVPTNKAVMALSRKP